MAHPELRGLIRRLTRWYGVEGRHDLPWRQTRDRYAVLVSEVMLQQTQVARVVPYWEGWMDRWPDTRALAGAETAEVIRAWSGLGYNRRAVNLQRAAREAVSLYGGRLPRKPQELRALPGVGPYTANAVACFADGQRVPVVDTNVARVIARAVLGVADGRRVALPRVEEAAVSLLPVRGARHRNLALMDLGAMVCQARQPACAECPLRSGCAWRAAGYPVEPNPQRESPPRFEDTARFARGRIVAWLREREAGSRAEVAAMLPPRHREEAGTYLAALERDGLVERREDGVWELAGAVQGRMSMASPKL
jgi:A/G-specific adenine glycosylase